MVSNVARRNLSLVAGNVTGGGGQPPQKTTYWHHIDRKEDVRFVETDFVARKGCDIN
jgi:hypothetical protein